MTSKDKYGIIQQVEKSVQKPRIAAIMSKHPDVFVNDIWEEVYTNMPLCDPEDPSAEGLMQVLKRRCGDCMKI